MTFLFLLCPDLPTVVQCQVYVDSFDSVSEASMVRTVKQKSWWRDEDDFTKDREGGEIQVRNMATKTTSSGMGIASLYKSYKIGNHKNYLCLSLSFSLLLSHSNTHTNYCAQYFPNRGPQLKRMLSPKPYCYIRSRPLWLVAKKKNIYI